MSKPIVHYRGEVVFLDDNKGAILSPIDHTSSLVSNTKPVLTSKIVDFCSLTGTIETENTLYIPAPT